MTEPSPGARAASSAPSVKDILQRVERRRSERLDPQTLRDLDRELAKDADTLRHRALELERETEEAFTRGRLQRVDEIHQELRRIARRGEEVDAERRKLSEALQHRILRDRMRARLGSERKVQILEGLVIALIFLVLGLLYYEFVTPGLSRETHIAITLIDTLCCGIFLIDFFFRHRCAESKSWYWRKYWLDFVTSIPIPDVQVLRFGRAARIARLARAARVLRFVRALRVLLFFWRGMDKLEDVLDVRLMKRSLMMGFTLLIAGSVIIYWVEGQNRGVESLGQSIWWSFTTLVTGGFGDIYNPGSPAGRILTVFLVLGGMIIVGIFTATLTSVLVNDDSRELTALTKQLESKIDDVGRRVEELSTDRPTRGEGG